MNYGEYVCANCIALLYEKNELLNKMYELDHQLEDLSKYDNDLLTDNMRITLYNKQNEYSMQKKQIQDRIDVIDTNFDLYIKAILLAFSRTNILDRTLIELLIYNTTQI